MGKEIACLSANVCVMSLIYDGYKTLWREANFFPPGPAAASAVPPHGLIPSLVGTAEPGGH